MKLWNKGKLIISEKVIRLLTSLHLIALLLISPFVYLMCVMGISQLHSLSMNVFYALFALSFVTVIISSILTLYFPDLVKFIFLSYLTFIFAFLFSYVIVFFENKKNCENLRNDPNCIEEETRFICNKPNIGDKIPFPKPYCR